MGRMIGRPCVFVFLQFGIGLLDEFVQYRYGPFTLVLLHQDGSLFKLVAHFFRQCLLLLCRWRVLLCAHGRRGDAHDFGFGLCPSGLCQQQEGQDGCDDLLLHGFLSFDGLLCWSLISLLLPVSAYFAIKRCVFLRLGCVVFNAAQVFFSLLAHLPFCFFLLFGTHGAGGKEYSGQGGQDDFVHIYSLLKRFRHFQTASYQFALSVRGFSPHSGRVCPAAGRGRRGRLRCRGCRWAIRV